MTAIKDSAIQVGKESTYGTPATLTTGFEGKADSFQRAQEPLESMGFRPGMHALRSDRRTQTNMGGEGSLEIDVLTKGFGLLLQAMLGSVSGPTQEAATAAYTTTAATTVDDPNDSYTIQVNRVDVGGTQRNFTHHGCVMTGWSLTQEVNGLLVAALNFDFEDVDTSTGAGSSTYPSGIPFDWTQAVVTLDSAATDVLSFNLEAELGLKTDRRFLRGSELKKQPVRSTHPTFTGSVDVEFEDLTLYADFVAGSIVPITATWTGANIEGAYDYELTVTMAACQYDGESPVANLDDVPTQSVPFKVLHNGSDAAIEITYTSTDTSL